MAEAVEGERSLYSHVKEIVCDLILVGAERWAAESGWTEANYDGHNLEPAQAERHAANTFLNGDPPDGPYERNVDPTVADCEPS